jgi:hypothetical protein
MPSLFQYLDIGFCISQGNTDFGRNYFGADFGVLAHHLNNAPSRFVFTDVSVRFSEFSIDKARVQMLQ